MGENTKPNINNKNNNNSLHNSCVCGGFYVARGGGDRWANCKQIKKGQHTKFLLVEDDFWMKNNLKYA